MAQAIPQEPLLIDAQRVWDQFIAKFGDITTGNWSQLSTDDKEAAVKVYPFLVEALQEAQA